MTSTPSDAVSPDATAIPFAELLAELRRRGFGIGLREYQDVAKLASKWQGIDRVAFRNALAAVLARDEIEAHGIRDVFDEWADAEAPAPPPRPRLWTWHIVAAVLIAVVTGVYFTWTIDRRNRSRPAISNVTPPPVTHTVAAQPPEPALPKPPAEHSPELPLVAAAAVAIAALLALAVREARRRQKDWAQRYWRHIVANEPGPHHYEPNVRASAPPLPGSVIDEVAAILGRRINADVLNADELDVEESLRRTLHEGMAPQLVFRAPPLNVPVVVLRDVSWQMRPWEAKVEYFVRELQRQGVTLDLWYFSGDPLRVSRTPDGPPISVEKLARSSTESSLMILSSGQGIDAGSLADLDRVLKIWQFRTWIHPSGNPEYWRRELKELDVNVWPMTRAGVHAAAVELSRRGDMNVPPQLARSRSVTRDDVERMKQLLGLAPSPSLPLAQELRRRFLPDVPEEVMLFLGAEGVFYGETIPFSPEQLRQLLVASARDPEREQSVRRYLLEMLRDSEPPLMRSAAHLRWALDEAILRLQLDPDDKDARVTLCRLADGPLRDEVLSATRFHGLDIAVRLLPSKGLPAQPPESLGRRPPLWAWPRLAAAVLAVIAVVPLTVLIAKSTSAGEGAPIAHLRGAYALRWDGQRLLAGVATPGVPRRVNLFRDGQPAFGLNLSDKGLSQVALSGPFYGAWYELRATLPKGNLATSYPVWVPKQQTTALLAWPNDDISRRVVEALRRVTTTPGEITESSRLANGPYRSLVCDEIDKEFGIQIPRQGLLLDTTLTAGKLVGAVRAALAAPDEGTVVLTFVTPDRVQLGNIEYLLSSDQVMGSVPGVASKPLIVKAASYNVVVVNTNVMNRLDLGTITVPPGQTLMREFVLRLRSQWQHDAVSRRVVAIIAREMRIPESEVTPSSPDDIPIDVLDTILQDFDIEFRPDAASLLVTPQRLVDATRAAVAAQTRPVSVQLTWVTTAGRSLQGFDFEIFGGGQTYRGVAGKTVAVPPGEYKVTAIDPPMPLNVQRIAISPGQPYRREFTVKERIGVTGQPLRSLTVALGRGFAGSEQESWSEQQDGSWIQLQKQVLRRQLRRHSRESVDSVLGIVVIDDLNRREYFIPDAPGSRNIMTHAAIDDPWELYGVITER